jgi:hypothetical protein
MSSVPRSPQPAAPDGAHRHAVADLGPVEA